MIIFWFPWVLWLPWQVLANLPPGFSWTEIVTDRAVLRRRTPTPPVGHMVLVHS